MDTVLILNSVVDINFFVTFLLVCLSICSHNNLLSLSFHFFYIRCKRKKNTLEKLSRNIPDSPMHNKIADITRFNFCPLKQIPYFLAL